MRLRQLREPLFRPRRQRRSEFPVAAPPARRQGPAGLARGPQEPDFASYLYWLHFANGTLQPIMGRNMILRRIDLPANPPVVATRRTRHELVLSQGDVRCAEAPYLAGAIFSAADIMRVFSLITMRSFCPLDLGSYPQIRACLQERIGVRDAYRRAMQKGDPEMVPMRS